MPGVRGCAEGEPEGEDRAGEGGRVKNTPTPTQIDALRRAIASTGRLFYLTGGFWVVDGVEMRTNAIPAWFVGRSSVLAMERGGGRDAHRYVTDAGRAATRAAVSR